jgi:SAM-dependent methyltransferase
MLAKICEQWRSGEPLGNILDEYFQRHTAPEAVRNRTGMVAEAIAGVLAVDSSEVVNVISVGSGPAIDVQLGVQSISQKARRRLHLKLLDLDEAALTQAQERLAPFLEAGQLQALRENLFRLPQRAARPNSDQADLVFCTGFFDYLSDADAAAMLRAIWNWLRPGGRLLVFNFAPHNPSRAFMEWMGNWYLTYRDRDQMHAIAAAAGLAPGSYRVTAEPLGVDLLIDARRA